ncbi:hypothetical protein [Streptomyces olivaceiscleroticus]
MQAEFLALLAAGEAVGSAADKLGVSRRTPTQLASKDQHFAYALDAARKQGAALRGMRHCARTTAPSEEEAEDGTGTAHIHPLPDTTKPTATTKFAHAS